MLILAKQYEGLGRPIHLIYSVHNALNPRRTLIEKQWIIMNHGDSVARPRIQDSGLGGGGDPHLKNLTSMTPYIAVPKSTQGL